MQHIDITDIEWATGEVQGQTRSGDGDFDQSAGEFFRIHQLEDANIWQEALDQFFLLKEEVL